jgi:FkbM family methyltransferase
MQVEECCQALLEHILPIVDEKKEGLCIDVGSGNFAFFCERFAKLGFKTVAVEPLPVDALKQICSSYNITLIEGCVSDVEGIQTLYIGKFQGVENLNLCTLDPDWWGASTETRQVPSVTLSSLLSSVKAIKVTCLKLDVEGAEYTIIRQFMELPEALLPSVVLFEYGGGDRKENSQKGWSTKFFNATLECLEILRKCGYSFSVLIDADPDADECIFDLQAFNLELVKIFADAAIYGNIISFRNWEFPENEVKEICVPFLQKERGLELASQRQKVNLIIFPNWSLPENLLCPVLEKVLRTLIAHPERERMTLLVNSSNISAEEANLILSSVAMNLFMQEELDVNEELQIFLVEQGLMECQEPSQQASARISFENEDFQAISTSKANQIPCIELASLPDLRVVELATGV